MPRPTEFQTIIEDAIAELLAAATPRLRQEIVRRVAAEVESLDPAPASSPTDVLTLAITAIQEANSQADILLQLLQRDAHFALSGPLLLVMANAIRAHHP